MLKLNGHGKWISAFIELPDGYDVNDIDVGTVSLNGAIPAESHPVEIGDNDRDGVPDLMVKFDRVAVQRIVSPGEEVAIEVCGSLGELDFCGTDLIRVRD